MTRNLLFAITLCLGLFSLGQAQTSYLTELSSLPISPTFGIGLKGDYLYVNPGFSELRVYDLSNPFSPQFVTTVTYTGDFGDGLEVRGNYLYLLGGPSLNVRIFDLANPALPVEIGLLTIANSGPSYRSAAITDSLIYIPTQDTLFTVNTADKNNPVVQNRLSTPFTFIDDAIAFEGFLYVGINPGTRIYSLANPTAPSFSSSNSQGNLRMALDPASKRLIAASSGHQVFDISTPGTMTFEFSSTGGSGAPNSIAYTQGIVLQGGPDFGPPTITPLNVYFLLQDSSIHEEEIFGSLQFDITDIKIQGNLVVVAKFGGIEIYEQPLETSLEEREAVEFMDLWPSPATDWARVRIREDLWQPRLEITDLNGRVLMEKQLLHQESGLELEALPAGLYLVNLYDDQEFRQSKRLSVR